MNTSAPTHHHAVEVEDHAEGFMRVLHDSRMQAYHEAGLVKCIQLQDGLGLPWVYLRSYMA